MLIKAVQRLTVIDFPGKLACTFFLFGCNFRCSFCHNPELVVRNNTIGISADEALAFLVSHRQYLDGVCFTGGEPLITLDKEFVKKVKALGYAIKIDTNGSFPERLQEFIAEGLVDYVAMDVKTTKEKYASLVGAPVDLKKLERSMQLIAALPAYEFRCTVIPGHHSLADIEEMKQWLLSVTKKEKLQSFFVQGFVARPGAMVSDVLDATRSPTVEELSAMENLLQSSFEQVEVRA
ncbi:MAG: anaerobic ribonucleoside-triphosphate reductase activating protein [Nanoarchaeota archaeon]|nr:anaerobic ribonucleoside-triphosphate reductase activating protein [Nanoarchaeota archaeon]